jgi:hypothetical protein
MKRKNDCIGPFFYDTPPGAPVGTDAETAEGVQYTVGTWAAPREGEPEPVFVNIYEAQESILRNQCR